MKTIVLYVLAAVALVLVGVLVVFNLAGRDAAKYTGEFVPDMSEIMDGNYEGEYHFLLDKLGAMVRFEVKNRKLLHCEFDQLFGTIGYGAPETIQANISQRKNLDFDAISGATMTSNFAKAAIRNALENGPE